MAVLTRNGMTTQSAMEKPHQQNHAYDKRKRKYRSDGTPTWTKANIDGPGVWVSCVKGKEKQTAGELIDLFNSVADELWPFTIVDDLEDQDHSEEDLEAQIAKEINSLKKPRKHQEHRFTNCQTNTPCVLFISCTPPIDPVKLVTTHVESVQQTGISHTRYAHRFVPVSGTCVANIPEIHSLCGRVFPPFFSEHPERTFSYKIDLRVRNHSTLSRPTIIQEIARCVPEGHTVNLENPDIFIIVEVFKSVCGVSIVRDYYRLLKFNVMEIANATLAEKQFGETSGRVKSSGEDGDGL